MSLWIFLFIVVAWFGGWWLWTWRACRETCREGRAPSVVAARLSGRWLRNQSPRGRLFRNLALAWALAPFVCLALVMLAGVVAGSD